MAQQQQTGWLYGREIDPYFTGRARVHTDWWRERRVRHGLRAVKIDEVQDMVAEALDQEFQQMLHGQESAAAVARNGVWTTVENLLNNPVPDDATKLETLRRMIADARKSGRAR